MWWIGSWGGCGQPEPDTLAAPIVDIAITATNEGYWITTADGTILPFGDAARLT